MVGVNSNLVKDVSRSFYLTLRLLPKQVRGVISLGYLLARASDTIADTASLPVILRVKCLTMFHESVKRGEVSSDLQALVTDHFSTLPHDGERVLMASLRETIECLKPLSGEERRAIEEVIQIIISGQLWDLQYFQERGELTHVVEGHQLEEYTYKVAGCVGEFWTEVLSFHGLILEEDKEELLVLGRNYGMGLQLTNIIRDIPEDYASGRVYIPQSGQSLESVIQSSEKWLTPAQDYLNDGIEYAQKLPKGILRTATILPAKLGLKTLRLLTESSLEERKRKVKISRATVFRELLKGFLS